MNECSAVSTFICNPIPMNVCLPLVDCKGSSRLWISNLCWGWDGCVRSSQWMNVQQAGFRHIDCAPLYPPLNGNEAEVGKAITQALSQGLRRRDEVSWPRNSCVRIKSRSKASANVVTLVAKFLMIPGGHGLKSSIRVLEHGRESQSCKSFPVSMILQ